MPNNEFFDLNKNQAYTIVSLVSEYSAIPNFLFIKELKDIYKYNIEKCLFICSGNKYSNENKESISIIKKFFKNIEIEVNDSNLYEIDFSNIKTAKEDIRTKFKDVDKSKILFNITGGNKMMSCALYDFAEENNIKNNIFYLYDNKIYAVEKSLSAEGPYSKELSNGLLRIDDYLTPLGNKYNKEHNTIEYKHGDQKINFKIIKDSINENFGWENESLNLEKENKCFIYRNNVYLFAYIKAEKNPITNKKYIKFKEYNGIIYAISQIQKKAGPFSRALIIVDKISNENIRQKIKGRITNTDICKWKDEEDKICEIIREELKLQENINVNITSNVQPNIPSANEENSVSKQDNSYIMVSLVGRQTIPNILLFNYFKKIKNININKNILIYTNKTNSQKDRIQQFLKDETEKIEFINVDPIVGIRDKINNKIKETSNIIFNITGGTTMMACALYDFAKQIAKNKNPNIWYVDGNTIYEWDNSIDIKNENLLYIKDYCKVVAKPDFSDDGDKDIEISEILNNEQKLSSIKIFCDTIITDMKYNKYKYMNLTSKIPSDPEREFKEEEKKGEEQAQTKLNQYKDILDTFNSKFKDKYNFKEAIPEYSKDISKQLKFIKSGWFEWYIYININTENKLINTSLKYKNNELNEIDVCFIYNNILYLIECKTHIRNEKFDEIINKLKYVQNLMGLFAKSIIVSLDNNRDEDIEKYKKILKKEKIGFVPLPLKPENDTLYNEIIKSVK